MQPSSLFRAICRTGRAAKWCPSSTSFHGLSMASRPDTPWVGFPASPTYDPVRQPSRRHMAKQKNESTFDQLPVTDFKKMDVLGAAPTPFTAIEICRDAGFQLKNGIVVQDGSGVLLVNGEAFNWRPWDCNLSKRFVNESGQWHMDEGALGLLSLLWPRPDLLILGLGPRRLPLSPETKRHISTMGMRVEVLDTRNAASQFDLLATERGVDNIAAALMPFGWRKGSKDV